jgi:riboflavin synthase alpha subunit
MFTGIVEELGRVAAIQALPDNAIRITIEGQLFLVMPIWATQSV